MIRFFKIEIDLGVCFMSVWNPSMIFTKFKVRSEKRNSESIWSYAVFLSAKWFISCYLCADLVVDVGVNVLKKMY